MNRFILADTPQESARMMCDKHVVKMILEEAQMLYTALALNGIDVADGYKPTHKAHPCTLWTAENSANYGYGVRLLEAMGDEYTYRYGKTHKTIRNHLDLLKFYESLMPQASTVTDWQFAGSEDAQRFSTLSECVDRYHRYYRETKRHIAKWSKRNVPKWWR